MKTCNLCKTELLETKRKGAIYCSGYCKVLGYKLFHGILTLEEVGKRLGKRKETDTFHSKQIQELADQYY